MRDPYIFSRSITTLGILPHLQFLEQIPTMLLRFPLLGLLLAQQGYAESCIANEDVNLYDDSGTSIERVFAGQTKSVSCHGSFGGEAGRKVDTQKWIKENDVTSGAWSCYGGICNLLRSIHTLTLADYGKISLYADKCRKMGIESVSKDSNRVCTVSRCPYWVTLYSS